MKTNLLESKFIYRLFWCMVLIGIWQVVSISGVFEPLLFPSIPTIYYALKSSLSSGSLIKESLYSLKLIGLGLSIGFIGAILLAIIGNLSRHFNGLVETIAAIAHPLPGIALLPLIILWMGTGANAILFIIVHSVVWPLYLNMNTGFRSIPKIYREVSQNIGLNVINEVLHVIIPASLPHILAGVKIGWARAWRALISAEMIFGAAGGKGGLGWYIFQKRVYMDTAGLYAGLFVIIIIGIFIEDTIFEKIEELTVKKWRTVA